jgi:hypothetical protein
VPKEDPAVLSQLMLIFPSKARTVTFVHFAVFAAEAAVGDDGEPDPPHPERVSVIAPASSENRNFTHMCSI